ncbi:hypothetical protein M0805_003582 [Coniferiporia weirii]|nr:hypothetical protein M0805_003582 [Coniferiporia weirii]
MPIRNLDPGITAVSPYWVSLIIFALCISLGRLLSRKRSSCLGLFPSPPSDPILGHMRIIPQKRAWILFAEWGKKLGDVIQLTIIGHPMIVLNSAESARDLLEKRGANYSDRPPTILHGKMINWGDMLAFARYGDQFRTQRRFVQQHFNSQASVSWRPVQIAQARVFIKNLLVSPRKFHQHVVRMSSANIVKITYGHDILSDDDGYVNLAVACTSRAAAAGIPGMTPVDLLPFIQYIPSWFPGAGFKRDAGITRKLSDRMMGEPYNQVKEERASGTAQHSLLNSLLEDYEKTGIVDKSHEVNMKFAAGTMYGAAVETSEAVVMTFILMMARNPEIMKRAQAEIDAVVGSEQLPIPEDRPNLPYIECILKELYRLNPPAPLGLLHRSMKEDVYRDKTIPAGTIITANIWQMMRDERYYRNPDEFNPERFLKKVTDTSYDYMHALGSFDAGDPSSVVFGFGRRICPGRFVADIGAWLAIANILAVFDILPEIDPETGKEMLPAVEFVDGFVSKPVLFGCRIIPRSAKHATLIKNECI